LIAELRLQMAGADGKCRFQVAELRLQMADGRCRFQIAGCSFQLQMIDLNPNLI